MKTSITIEDLTAEQWRWANETWRPGAPDGNDVRVCAVLAGPKGIERHIEVSVSEFILAFGELVRVERFGLLAEAALTPDILPDVIPDILPGALPAGAFREPRGRRAPAPVNDDLEQP